MLGFQRDLGWGLGEKRRNDFILWGKVVVMTGRAGGEVGRRGRRGGVCFFFFRSRKLESLVDDLVIAGEVC